MTPLRARKGFKDVEAWGHLPADVFNMFVESETGVESDTEDFGVFFEWYELISCFDLWMVVELVGPWREQRDCGLFGS